MKKEMGATLLIAGTCIGSGMIALPLVLAKLGLLLSILIMLGTWLVMYYTSLVNLELNLQAGKGLYLGELAKKFSGKKAEWIGIISLKTLSYSLLAAFLYGGSSILLELLQEEAGLFFSFEKIAIAYALLSGLLLMLPLRIIDYFNRILFFSLLIVVTILLTALTFSIVGKDLPLFPQAPLSFTSFSAILPVVFTSFGFQVIFHTLSNYCKMDAKVLKKAFFLGSLIPAIVYILWTSSILAVIYHDNPDFYSHMNQDKAEVGELIQVLTEIAEWSAIQHLIWWISSLAIATSVIGVGISLHESLKLMLPKGKLNNFLASLFTILPAFLVVILIPNAFISVLAFAGMVLSFIAILLPIYLFKTIQGKTLHYAELKNDFLLQLSLAIGIIIIVCELYNMVNL